MGIPLEVTFNGVAASEALRDNIETHVAKIAKLAPDALDCRVAVRFAGHRRHKGNRYHVHVRLLIPGAVLNASPASSENAAYEDAYVAVRDAFDALRRQLEDTAQRRRGEVKTHFEPPHGTITRLFHDAGYGIIEAMDGREIRFHRNSLVDAAFHELDLGREVRFTEAPGRDGPWASTVHVTGRRTALPS